MPRKPVVEESQIARIPVCLKFDVNDEFYTNFVLSLKQTRELSTFIVKILKTYYEKSTVSKAVDEVLEEESPFASIRESLERIAEMNITNHMAISSMKGTLNIGKSVLSGVQNSQEDEEEDRGVVKGFENEVGFEVDPKIEPLLLQGKSAEEIIQIVAEGNVVEENVEVESTAPENKVTDEATEQRFRQIEKKLEVVDTINQKLDTFLSSFMTNNVKPVDNVSEVNVENSVENVKSEVIDVIVEDKEATVTVDNIDDETEIDLDAEFSVEDIMEQALAMSQATADATKTVEVVEEKPKVSKAFSKLVSSI